MDFTHRFGVLAIQHLQNNYREYCSFLSFMSTVGDPRNIFSIYFPLWFHLNNTDIFSFRFVEILLKSNAITKYHRKVVNPVPGGFCFCAGSPSGHAMGSSCVWYVMITSALKFASGVSSVRSSQRFHFLRSFLWVTFWVIQISVCLSRVYIATHFPHQVILGLIAGMLVAEVFDHIPSIYRASLKSYLQVNVFLLSFAVCFYLLLKLLDFDPLWSVVKAKKWCANPDWIHLDTTPFAGLWRNLGALFGLGLAVNSEMFVQSCKGKNGSKAAFKLMCVAASLTFLQLCDLIKMPTHNEALFYFLSFCKSASVPFGVAAVVLYCVHLLIRDEERKLS
uniref:glucose-6-phosphatase n=1 Tax=Kryptolebias marmoratus TaxID=37003 RepID=A0A3Q3AV71_KRYMA